jgi:hypothetical protein
MGVNWSKDIDQTLTTAKEQSRAILLDRSGSEVESLKRIGGDDGTRTRGLCRDSSSSDDGENEKE